LPLLKFQPSYDSTYRPAADVPQPSQLPLTCTYGLMPEISGRVSVLSSSLYSVNVFDLPRQLMMDRQGTWVVISADNWVLSLVSKEMFCHYPLSIVYYVLGTRLLVYTRFLTPFETLKGIVYRNSV